VRPRSASRVAARLARGGEQVYEIGRVKRGRNRVEFA
jgi:hypothetical protein